MWQVLKELILAIFYPHYCPACHEEVEGTGLLCEACRRSTYAPGYLELEKETVPHLDAVYRLYRYEGGSNGPFMVSNMKSAGTIWTAWVRKSCTTRQILSLYLQEILLS